MAVPVRITFNGVDSSEAMEARIREKAEKLARFAALILDCHVTVEAPHRHHHQGKLYRVLVEIDVPRGRIVAGENGSQDDAHEDPYVALRDAFAAATRQLEDHARKLDGAVKHHEPVLAHDRVARFIAGEEVYFHRNAVAKHGFDRLKVGDAVRVAVTEGEKGPQASAVHPLGA